MKWIRVIITVIRVTGEWSHTPALGKCHLLRRPRRFGTRCESCSDDLSTQSSGPKPEKAPSLWRVYGTDKEYKWNSHLPFLCLKCSPFTKPCFLGNVCYHRDRKPDIMYIADGNNQEKRLAGQWWFQIDGRETREWLLKKRGGQESHQQPEACPCVTPGK